MQIDIEKDIFKAIAKRLEDDDSEMAETIKFRAARLREGVSSTVPVSLAGASLKILRVIHEELKEGEDPSSRVVASLYKALKNPDERKIRDISEFPEVFKRWFTKLEDVERGWLFSTDSASRPLAYLVVNVEFHEGHDGRKRDKDADSVTIGLASNMRHDFDEHNIRLSRRKVDGKTVPQILAEAGYTTESPKLIEAYEKDYKRFLDFRGMQAEQFYCRGKAFMHGRSFWNFGKMEDLSPLGTPTRCVLDEDHHDGGDSNDSEEVTYRSERAKFHSALFEKTMLVPWHPLLYVFHLTYHRYFWLHCRDMRPYDYDETLADKVVMPKSHKRLIKALTSKVFIPRKTDEGEKRSRVIRTKAQSTIILCGGDPGLGKTLTAEAYAEKIKRPLYEVHSGQLGLDSDSIEDLLMAVLKRAKRLKMVLVVNEADVFVKKRGDDMRQNAVVGVFLRVLEYHAGLIFMTTNRLELVDDAFLNRCLAVIRYTYPDEEGRRELWEMLSEELDVSLSKDECKTLAEFFPEVSGRDVQNLIILVKRFIEANDQEDARLKDFVRGAVFKGIRNKNEIKEEKKK